MPHSVTVYGPPTVVQQTESGGELITWPTVRALNVPCLINFGNAGESDEFNQSQSQRTSHTIAFAGDNYGGLQPGDKLVDDVTGVPYRFTGDRLQQGVGGIEDFVFATVTQFG